MVKRPNFGENVVHSQFIQHRNLRYTSGYFVLLILKFFSLLATQNEEKLLISGRVKYYWEGSNVKFVYDSMMVLDRTNIHIEN